MNTSDPTTTITHPPVPDVPGMAIWQGCSFAWRIHNHRLARLASILDSFDDTSAPIGLLRFRHVTEMNVGPLGGDDFGDAFAYATRITSNDLEFIHGAHNTEVTGTVDTGPVVKTGPTITVPLPFPAGSAVVATVIMRGFRVACLSDPGTIPTRGFGFELTNITVSGSNVSFVPRFTIHPDGSESFPFIDGSSFTYNMGLYYTVIAAADGKAAFHVDGGSVAQYTGRRLAPVQRNEQVVGHNGNTFNGAVLGIRGFRWALQDFPGTAEDGRHIRQLHAYLSNCGYSPATGRMSYITRQWFDNTDISADGFNAVHELLPTLIQFNDDLQPAHAVLYSLIDASGSGQVLQTLDL